MVAKVIHVGHGYWGKNVARSLSRLGALAGLVDPHARDLADIAAGYGVPVLSFEDAIAHPDAQAISLATPAPMHFEQAKKALEAGKHVMVEKPITLDMAEAEALAGIAEKQGRVLLVGHLMQYHPAFIKLREMVEAGRIGKVLHCYSNRLSLGKLRVHENVLWSFAPHDFSMLLSVAGRMTSVSAQGQAVITPGIADFATAQLTFEGGARGHVNVSWLHPFKEQRLVVTGETGTLVFEDSQADWSRKLVLYPYAISGMEGAPVAKAGEAHPIEVTPGEPLLEECRHFIECIDKGLPARTDSREAIGVLGALQAAEKGLRASLNAPMSSAPAKEAL